MRGALCFCFFWGALLAPVPLFADAGPSKEEIASLDTLELIALLAHPEELTQRRAYNQLSRYLVVETDTEAYYDRLTLFHKHAPHACRKGHEAQTLHILALFAEQKDVSSILVLQCLRSPSSKVQIAALEITPFSDNRIDEALLAFVPDAVTLSAYRKALRKLDTPAASKRLEGLR